MSFKICAIGCGSMANRGHGPSFARYKRENPQVSLLACCDLDEKRAGEYAQKFGFERFYTDMDQMLLKEKPDAVSLVVPFELTASLSIKIMRMGIPLILEKPPGLNREETLRMIEAAEAAGTPNMVAFNRRHMPLVCALKGWLAGAHHAQIHSIQYDFCRVGRLDEFSTTAIHGIDTARFLAGKSYQSVRFFYEPIAGARGMTVNIFMECRFEGGASASLRFYPLSGVTIERADLHAAGHSYFLEMPVFGGSDCPGRLLHFEKGKCVDRIDGADLETDGYIANGFYGENKAFFDAVQAGVRPADDIASGLQSVLLAQCVRERAATFQA